MEPLASPAEATILLVDDNPANLGVLTQLLTAQSWRVLVAQQGESGLRIAQRVQPDLIMLDVLLPGMDGFATCRRLKADVATAEIPVLFMTVRMEAADKLKGFQAGAVDYITKPFQAEEVLARVRTHLRLRQLTHSLQEQNEQLQQEIAERRQAEAALQRAHVELERRVQERTAELIQANADLQAQIAERRRIEEELLTERNLLRTLIDNAPEQIYVKDTESQFVLANTATMMRLNISTPDQLLGKTDIDFFLPEQAAEYRAEELAVLQSGRPMVNKEESSINPQTGTLSWGLTTKVPVRDAHGQIIGLVGMSRDITELKRAEEQLRANEIQLRAYTQRLEILHAIDQAILAAHSIEAIAEAALGHMRALIPCRWASVAVFDRDVREIAVLAIHANDHGEPVVQTSGTLEPSQIVDALRRGEVQVVEDTAAFSAPALIAAPIPDTDVRSYVNVPLIAAGDLLGILTVGSNQPQVFTPAHVAIAREVASQIAVAIQNARLFADMSAARAHLQAVSRQLVAIQEAERAHIARDLHDEIGQMLTGLKLVLAIGTRSKPAMVLARLAEAQALINELTTRVREISLDLRPAMLDDLGLLPTLLWHVKRYTEQTQIQVAMKHTGLDQRLAPDVEIAVYRLVQEGLTNVARHADVRDVAIWLWRTADSVGVRIKDQGRGFTPKEVLAAHTSSGLAGMIERVRLLGGQLTIESAPGQGTRLTAELPLGDADETGA
jgi:PAS domain S-box-containing protein